jgi:hypothetical protein
MRSVARAAFITVPLVAATVAFPEAILSIFTGSAASIAGAAPTLRLLGRQDDRGRRRGTAARGCVRHG